MATGIERRLDKATSSGGGGQAHEFSHHRGRFYFRCEGVGDGCELGVGDWRGWWCGCGFSWSRNFRKFIHWVDHPLFQSFRGGRRGDVQACKWPGRGGNRGGCGVV